MKGGNKRNRNGIVLGFLFFLCHAVADYFSTGALFKVFTSHKSSQDTFTSSATATLFGKLYFKCRNLIEKVKIVIARQFEQSLTLQAMSSFLKKLLGFPSRFFGAFFMTWSSYVIIICLIKHFVLSSTDEFISPLVCGCIVFSASVPLMFSDKSLYRLCAESPFVYTVLTKVFGVPTEVLKGKKSIRVGQSVAVAFGIFLGLATYFINPVDMIMGIVSLIGMTLVFAYPEGGVVISIAIAPLLGLTLAPSRILVTVVLLTAVAYLIKVIRGKRVFKFGITELAVYAFMLAVFIGGFAPGSSNTFEHAILCCALMMIFPLTVNLMRNKRWIRTCIAAFVVPSAGVAFFGIAQYFLGLAPLDWIDESIFVGITARAVSVFNNPNILGAYLTMLFPFALMLTLLGYNFKVRTLGVIASVFIIVCTALTFSRSAWIALAVGGILFAVMITPKGILWIIPTSGAAVGAALLFPESIGSRIINFITVADSANSYRMSVWDSSWELLTHVFAGGIGMGEEAFKTAYMNFAAPGTQYAMHSHSLYMQIVIQLGIIGLIIFLLVLLAVGRKCFSSAANHSSGKELKHCIKAALSGAASLLAAGIFDYTWYNYRVFFIFWALLGFACAAANLNDAVIAESYDVLNDEYSSYVTVAIPRENDIAEDEYVKELDHNE